MALPAVILTGLAQFVGVSGVITYSSAAIFPLQKNYKVNHDFNVDEVKDPGGYDVAWGARNEYFEISLGMYLVDNTGYTASPSAGTVANAVAGAFFPAPIGEVVLSGFGNGHTYGLLNANWQVRPGSTIDLDNAKCGEIEWKLRRYANAAQQALMIVTPTA